MSAYKMCKDALSDLCNEGRPDMPDGDEDTTITEAVAIVQQTVKEIFGIVIEAEVNVI